MQLPLPGLCSELPRPLSDSTQLLNSAGVPIRLLTCGIGEPLPEPQTASHSLRQKTVSLCKKKNLDCQYLQPFILIAGTPKTLNPKPGGSHQQREAFDGPDRTPIHRQHDGLHEGRSRSSRDGTPSWVT